VILLFGGTSETAELALALAQTGEQILVSTATDAPLDIGDHPAILRRCGRLDRLGIVALIKEKSICVVVDGSHPYAVELHATVAAAAQQAAIPCLRYQRKTVVTVEDDLFFVVDHQAAAVIAVELEVPVLLTTGSRQLSPYVELLKSHPHPESEYACDQAGLPSENRIVGRGPFSEAENRELIRSKGIGVLITKDSGTRGGVAEKISAARQENCQVIVVQRPVEEQGYNQVFTDIDDLIVAVNVSPP